MSSYCGKIETRYFFFVDRTGFPPIITVLNVVRTPVCAYVVALMAVGVILSLICLAFNIIFRKRKWVVKIKPQHELGNFHLFSIIPDICPALSVYCVSPYSWH